MTDSKTKPPEPMTETEIGIVHVLDGMARRLAHLERNSQTWETYTLIAIGVVYGGLMVWMILR